MKHLCSTLLFLLISGLIAGCQAVPPILITDTPSTQAIATPNTSLEPASDLTPRIEPSPISTVTLQPYKQNPDLMPSDDYSGCSDHPCLLPGHFLLQNPIPAGYNQQVDHTYRFGTTQQGLREIHHGVEFANPSGTPVLAAADGVVVFAGDDSLVMLGLRTYFYGNVVVIEHHLEGFGEPYFTVYAHLSEVGVMNGDDVVSGQTIGKVGRSGSAVGSHLHFEVRREENTYDSVINPELWLTLSPDPEGPTYGALVGRIQNANLDPLRVTSIHLEYSQIEGGTVNGKILLPTYFDDRVNSDHAYRENFAISSLQPGWYRVAFTANGAYYSKWVEVAPDMATYLFISMK
ncbi:MAG: M23 family metallopeptidase [Anaerolineaceae bacterium]|nr:M23 family metallopeptidase [Anaerolineaceae bacterium]MBN2676673.1 M23 family metallopeptidase [Anaerolineaceae bacterium]